MICRPATEPLPYSRASSPRALSRQRFSAIYVSRPQYFATNSGRSSERATWVNFPAAYDAVRYAGAAYLMFLAWQSFTSHRLLAPSSCEAQRRSPLAAFRQGLLTNLLNPKMALFCRSDTSRCTRASGSFCCWAGRSRAVFS
ncbi:MAG: LysE family transporter [Tardiphaga sp.]